MNVPEELIENYGAEKIDVTDFVLSLMMADIRVISLTRDMVKLYGIASDDYATYCRVQSSGDLEAINISLAENMIDPYQHALRDVVVGLLSCDSRWDNVDCRSSEFEIRVKKVVYCE